MPNQSDTDRRGGARGPFLEHHDFTDAEPANKIATALNLYVRLHGIPAARVLTSPHDAAAADGCFPTPIACWGCIAPGQFWLDGGRDA